LEHYLFPLRTTTERVLHAVIFEVAANVLVFIILIIGASAAPAKSALLTVVSSTLAMGWNYLFNLMFDRVQQQTGFKKDWRMRCLHSVLFEAGLLLVDTLCSMVAGYYVTRSAETRMWTGAIFSGLCVSVQSLVGLRQCCAQRFQLNKKQ
jgi:uncharacterized membrane protein